MEKVATTSTFKKRGLKRIVLLGILALSAGGYTILSAGSEYANCSDTDTAYCQGYCAGAGQSYDGCAVGNSGTPYCLCY